MKSLSRSNSILEQIADGILILDFKKRMVFANRFFLELFGLRKNPGMKKTLRKIINHSAMKKILDRAYQNREVLMNQEISLTSPVERSLLVNLSPWWGEDKEFQGVIGIFSDRTERQRIEREMREIDKSMTLSGVTSWVAHEIRNPLNSMAIHLELLRQQIVEKRRVSRVESGKMITIMKEEIDRLEKTIKEFLVLNRPAQLNKTSQDLNFVVQKVVDFIAQELNRKKIQLHPKYRKQLPMILMDELQFRQALLNLVVNAIQAMPKGGTLVITTRARRDYVFVDVKDTGIGIPKQNMHKLFEYFFTTKEEGTGLGLTIANKIVRDHGGRISVRSKENFGSSFTIKLPIDGEGLTRTNSNP